MRGCLREGRLVHDPVGHVPDDEVRAVSQEVVEPAVHFFQLPVRT